MTDDQGAAQCLYIYNHLQNFLFNLYMLDQMSESQSTTKNYFELVNPEHCRLCLKSSNDVVYTLRDKSLIKQIQECVSIKIEPDDEYSKHVCRCCIEKIDNWQTFKTMCLNSKESLQAKKLTEVCENIEILPKVSSSELNEKINCTICGKTVLKKSLRQHLTKHSDKFKCDQCNSTFSSDSLRKSHIAAKHLKLKLFYCDSCGKGFATKTNLIVHLKVHSNVRLYKCNQCTYEAKTSTLLNIHKSKHENGTYVCEYCSKVFKSQRHLRDHRIRVHTPKHVKCEICSKMFIFRYLLEQHKRTHTGVHPFCCHICSRTFARSDGLKDHLRTHEVSFKCEFCAKEFKTKRGVKGHNCHKIIV